MSSPAPEVHAIVLAGDRAPADPVAEHCGVAGKALAIVAGRAMLTRVLDCLSDLPSLAGVVLLRPPGIAFDEAAAASRLAPSRLLQLPAAATPAASTAAALAHLPEHAEVFLVTADHPLLRRDWLIRLHEEARIKEAGFATALVPLELVQRRWPASRRTGLRFSDGHMFGSNLFLFRARESRELAQLWQQLEQHRKEPWRLAAWLGAGALLKYFAGRMSRQEAFALLSRRAGTTVLPVLLDDPEAAIDVDSPEDLALVERLLLARRAHATH